MISNKREPFNLAISAMFTNPEFQDYLFYGSTISQVQMEMNSELPAPAGVYFCSRKLNYILIINPEKFNSYPLEIRIGILAHEVLHLIWNHLTDIESRDLRKWQLATDCSINQFINPEHLPEGVITPELLDVPRNLSSEEYYNLLDSDSDYSSDSDIEYGQSNEEIQQSEQCKSESDSDSIIEHGQSNEEIQQSEQCKSESDSDSIIEHGQSNYSNHSEWQSNPESREIQELITSRIIHNAQEFTESHGTVPHHISEMIAKNTESKILWKRELRKFLDIKSGERRTFKKPNRRFPNNPLVRGSVKDRKPDISVILDVSGSISDSDISQALAEIIKISEIQGFGQGSNIELIQVDSEPREPEILNKNTQVIERKGHGGTYLSLALSMIKSKTVLVITDGYLHPEDIDIFNSSRLRIIWLLTKKNSRFEKSVKSKLLIMDS